MKTGTNRSPYTSRVVVLVLAVALSGDAASATFREMLKQSVEDYPSPTALTHEPGTGILLVDGVIKAAWSTMTLDGVVVVNTSLPDKEILSGTIRTRGLRRSDGIVIFANLEPGTYRLVRIKASNVNQWRVQPVPESPEFEIKIEPDHVYYIGQIVAQLKMGSRNATFRTDWTKEREAIAWKQTIDAYPDSPWLATLNERLSTLQ